MILYKSNLSSFRDYFFSSNVYKKILIHFQFHLRSNILLILKINGNQNMAFKMDNSKNMFLKNRFLCNSSGKLCYSNCCPYYKNIKNG